MKKHITAYLPALISAFLLTLSSPGFDLWYLAYFALVPVVYAGYKHPAPFRLFTLFGFLYFFYNLRWIETSVSFFGGAPSFVGYCAAAAFALFLSLFWGIFGWLLGRRNGETLLLSCIWVCLEVVKGSILTGFPWLNLAHTQHTFTPAIQIAELGGEHLVSLVIIYFNISLARFAKDRNKHSLTPAVVLLCAVFVYGFIAEARKYDHNTLNTRIIQPAYSQSEKWNTDSRDSIFLSVSDMIRNSEYEKYDLLILPETVYPAFMTEDLSGYALMSHVSKTTPVMAGGIRFQDSQGERKYFNSVFMFNGGKAEIYDKRHLVPFGEYFPLGGIFKPIDYYFFKGAEDFSVGSEASVFTSAKVNPAPLVCYESAYSRLVTPQIEKGADIITVVTNDSWFGMTQGPAQHLATDVFRAVESRRSVVRAAQTGISACIDPKGRVTDSLPLGKKGYMDCNLELLTVKTVFTSAGYGWLVVFLATVYLWDRRKKRRNNN